MILSMNCLEIVVFKGTRFKSKLNLYQQSTIFILSKNYGYMHEWL
jgi:hypothetical protein